MFICNEQVIFKDNFSSGSVNCLWLKSMKKGSKKNLICRSKSVSTTTHPEYTCIGET